MASATLSNTNIKGTELVLNLSLDSERPRQGIKTTTTSTAATTTTASTTTAVAASTTTTNHQSARQYRT
jgi:hypothetical protein